MSALLQVHALEVQYRVRRSAAGRRVRLQALRGVEFALRAREALGVVGESGCGKSTLARAILGLVVPCAGRIDWEGQDIASLAGSARQRLHRELQIIFQNPPGSLDPRMSVGEIVAEPLRVHRRDLGAAARARVARDTLAQLGLGEEFAQRYPHELSGGQCQRVAIARAMILEPKLLVCDEAVSALDMSMQAQIIALLRALRETRTLALLFISHNLAVVRELCDHVLVLYLGRMMELAPAALLYARPLHPYTRALFAAIPLADPEVQPKRLHHIAPGEPPSALTPPAGCVFHTRCPYAIERCTREIPAWERASDGRYVACHRWREI
jgi:oligopeptide/dipeptide ABC transporter ATP-binding protein